MRLQDILHAALKLGASDIHLIPGRRPHFRLDGEVRGLKVDPFSPEQVESTIFEALSDSQIEKFRAEDELDLSLAFEDLGRFRVNVLRQKDGVAAVLRVISADIPDPREIGIDDTILELTELPRGLVLVTGPTGCGKSTTLASLINVINQTRKQHILTIEDPIEYVYPEGLCVVTQREIGSHSRSFASSLKRALRQDPDIILVGELRDLETISAALTLAETGHLVFATLHTTDAAQTVDRIVDVFPPFQQQQVRAQLAGTLKAVICQQLLPLAQGKGRVAAREVMIVNNAVANLIREGKTHQIYSAIEVGAKFGMKSLEKHLSELVQTGQITAESAFAKANDPDAVRSLIGSTSGSLRGSKVR